MLSSSSTMSTLERRAAMSPAPGEGKREPDGGAGGPLAILDGDGAAVIAHDAEADGEAEPYAGRLRREERLEDLLAQIRGDARPGVLDRDREEGALHARADHERAAVGHRVRRVEEEVEEHLLELVRIAEHLGHRPARAEEADPLEPRARRRA